jgi:hypothetical protein
VCWYSITSIIAVILFFSQLKQAFINNTFILLIIGFISVIVAIVGWYWSLVRRAYVGLEISRNIFFAKTIEILFQQIMIWGLFGILGSFIPFSLIFFVIHIPLLIVLPWKKGFSFIMASLAGGFAFAACLAFIPAGFLFALALHVGFYAAIASQKQIFGMRSFYSM